MEIIRWKVEAGLVDKGMQDPAPRIKASSPCPCGCSPKPFVLITDGELGLTVRFDTEGELDTFKQQVGCMQLTDWPCRYCEHLKKLSKGREKFVGGCEYGLLPETCGKFELAKCYEGHDPRKMKH